MPGGDGAGGTAAGGGAAGAGAHTPTHTAVALAAGALAAGGGNAVAPVNHLSLGLVVGAINDVRAEAKVVVKSKDSLKEKLLALYTIVRTLLLQRYAEETPRYLVEQRMEELARVAVAACADAGLAEAGVATLCTMLG